MDEDFDQAGIRNLIPQRQPIEMINHFQCGDSDNCSSWFVIDEDCFFNRERNMMDVGILENMAQTAAALAGWESVRRGGTVKPGYIGEFRKVEIMRAAKNGETVVTKLHIIAQAEAVTLAEVVSLVGSEVIARGQIKIFIDEKRA